MQKNTALKKRPPSPARCSIHRGFGGTRRRDMPDSRRPRRVASAGEISRGFMLGCPLTLVTSGHGYLNRKSLFCLGNPYTVIRIRRGLETFNQKFQTFILFLRLKYWTRSFCRIYCVQRIKSHFKVKKCETVYNADEELLKFNCCLEPHGVFHYIRKLGLYIDFRYIQLFSCISRLYEQRGILN